MSDMLETSRKLETLKIRIKNKFSPIMVQGLNVKQFKDAVIMPANIGVDELGEQFINGKWSEPKWLKALQGKAKNSVNLLIIDDITAVSKEEQSKFIQILKSKKAGKFDLPQNCTIIVLVKSSGKENINAAVYSLCSHV